MRRGPDCLAPLHHRTYRIVMNTHSNRSNQWWFSTGPDNGLVSNRWKAITYTTDDPGGVSKNTYELLNLRALKFSTVNKIYIFLCMGKIFCVEFQSYPLKFHIKYLTHTLKDMILTQHWNLRALRFKSSYAFFICPPVLSHIHIWIPMARLS